MPDAGGLVGVSAGVKAQWERAVGYRPMATFVGAASDDHVGQKRIFHVVRVPRDYTRYVGPLGWAAAEPTDVSTTGALIAPTRRAKPWPALSRSYRSLR